MKVKSNLDFESTAKPVNLPTPSSAGDAAPKSYVDAVLLNGQFRPTITNHTGGTSADLDSIPTVGVPVGLCQMVLYNDEFQVWTLSAGTLATVVANGTVRGVDYATTTNEKYWLQTA